MRCKRRCLVAYGLDDGIRRLSTPYDAGRSADFADHKPCSVVCSRRLTFALGQDPGGVQAGQDHEGPQECADQGPQQAATQGGTVRGCVGLAWPLAEDVLVRVGRETKYSAKQEEQNDVDVQSNLPGEPNQGRFEGGSLISNQHFKPLSIKNYILSCLKLFARRGLFPRNGQARLTWACPSERAGASSCLRRGRGW